VRRAFVVQFDATTEIGRRFAGRVEHVVSGQATQFQTLQDLLTFVARILTSESVVPPPAL
jgi:hypothetical protein